MPITVTVEALPPDLLYADKMIAGVVAERCGGGSLPGGHCRRGRRGQNCDLEVIWVVGSRPAGMNPGDDGRREQRIGQRRSVAKSRQVAANLPVAMRGRRIVRRARRCRPSPRGSQPLKRPRSRRVGQLRLAGARRFRRLPDRCVGARLPRSTATCSPTPSLPTRPAHRVETLLPTCCRENTHCWSAAVRRLATADVARQRAIGRSSPGSMAWPGSGRGRRASASDRLYRYAWLYLAGAVRARGDGAHHRTGGRGETASIFGWRTMAFWSAA